MAKAHSSAWECGTGQGRTPELNIDPVYPTHPTCAHGVETPACPLCPLERQLKIPAHIIQTSLKLDTILVSETTRQLVLLELTVCNSCVTSQVDPPGVRGTHDVGAHEFEAQKSQSPMLKRGNFTDQFRFRFQEDQIPSVTEQPVKSLEKIFNCNL